MPHWEYSITGLDPDKTVKCSGREIRISPKAATEICRAIRGMRLEQAKQFLEQVTTGSRPIEYRRYKKEVPHKSLNNWYAGRYPIKASNRLLKLLEQLESNAEYRGLETDRLRIIHASCQRGRRLLRFQPRAFGRSSPTTDVLTHIELVAFEGPE